MTDKQREATKIVLQQVFDSNLDFEEALTILDSIIGEPTKVEYVPQPTFPWTTPIQPYYGGTGAPEFQPPYKVTCEFAKRQ